MDFITTFFIFFKFQNRILFNKLIYHNKHKSHFLRNNYYTDIHQLLKTKQILKYNNDFGKKLI